MIHIIDDVLSEEEIEEFEEQVIGLNNVDKIVQYDQIKFVHPILKVVSQYFDLTKCSGYEIWQHNKTEGFLPWHHDRDEILYAKKKIANHPVCGIVYYLAIDEDLKGGGLLFENNERVIPKTNRMVLFDGTLLHSVEKYTGRRHSVNINPWNEKYQPFL